MKKIVFFVYLFILLLASCGNTDDSDNLKKILINNGVSEDEIDYKYKVDNVLYYASSKCKSDSYEIYLENDYDKRYIYDKNKNELFYNNEFVEKKSFESINDFSIYSINLKYNNAEIISFYDFIPFLIDALDNKTDFKRGRFRQEIGGNAYYYSFKVKEKLLKNSKCYDKFLKFANNFTENDDLDIEVVFIGSVKNNFVSGASLSIRLGEVEYFNIRL